MEAATRVLVTGGTSGLGLAMATALAGAGLAVALTGRSGARAAEIAAALPSAVGIGFRAVVDANLTGYFLMAREVVPRMLAAGGGRVVNIAVSESTMTRAGFVPYGPSRAGSESLSRIMAADLRGSSVTVNLLLPGGPTATRMLPAAAVPRDRPFLEPGVMGTPIVWLARADVHDERIVADGFGQ